MAADLVSQGWQVFLPVSDGSEVDLIGRLDGRNAVFQIKYAGSVRRDCLYLDLLRPRQGVKKKTALEGLDYIAFYASEWNEVKYLKPSSLPPSQKTHLSRDSQNWCLPE